MKYNYRDCIQIDKMKYYVILYYSTSYYTMSYYVLIREGTS